MWLKVVLPCAVLADIRDVASIVATTLDGAIGLLPHRLDCTAALPQGILSYTTKAGETGYLAIDQGVLAKTGDLVTVSVRHGLAGRDLGRLRADVEQQFAVLDAGQREARAVMARLEADLLRRLGRLQHG